MASPHDAVNQSRSPDPTTFASRIAPFAPSGARRPTGPSHGCLGPAESPESDSIRSHQPSAEAMPTGRPPFPKHRQQSESPARGHPHPTLSGAPRSRYRDPAANSTPTPVLPSPQSRRADARTHVVSGQERLAGATPSCTPIRAWPTVTSRSPTGPRAASVAKRNTPTSSTSDHSNRSPAATGWRPPIATVCIARSAAPRMPDPHLSTTASPPASAYRCPLASRNPLIGPRRAVRSSTPSRIFPCPRRTCRSRPKSARSCSPRPPGFPTWRLRRASFRTGHRCRLAPPREYPCDPSRRQGFQSDAFRHAPRLTTTSLATSPRPRMRMGPLIAVRRYRLAVHRTAPDPSPHWLRGNRGGRTRSLPTAVVLLPKPNPAELAAAAVPTPIQFESRINGRHDGVQQAAADAGEDAVDGDQFGRVRNYAHDKHAAHLTGLVDRGQGDRRLALGDRPHGKEAVDQGDSPQCRAPTTAPRSEASHRRMMG